MEREAEALAVALGASGELVQTDSDGRGPVRTGDLSVVSRVL